MNENDDIVLERDGREEDGMSEVELEAQESRADTKLAKLRKELEQCKAERQEHLDGWQRAKADYVNALKRFEEEKREAKLEGTLTAASAFIAVLDSLAHAQRHGEIPDAFAPIARQLESAASSLGLTAFGSVGDAFDPALYEALGQDPVASAAEDDIVTAVLEQGWKAGEAVIRPAKVRVGAFGG